jgi:hypothetical protein
MTTKEIADQLIAHCRKGNWEAAQRQLYAADAVSVEREVTPVFAKETKGLVAIVEKGHTFDRMVEMHAIEVSEPLVSGNSIAFRLRLDMTMKGRGRSDSAELCVYQVKDGKIVSEQFFS